MKRNILYEVNRMREIMGLNLILEQSDDERENIVKRFKSKLTEKSEIYWETGGGTDTSCIPKYMFKFKVPLNYFNPKIQQKYTQGGTYSQGDKEKIGGWTTNTGVYGDFLYTNKEYLGKIFLNKEYLGKNKDGSIFFRTPDQKERYEGTKYYDEKNNLYYNMKLKDRDGSSVFYINRGGDTYLNPEYNDTAAEVCKKKTQDVEIPPLTEEIKEAFIQEYIDWCIKKKFVKEDGSLDISECYKNTKEIKIKPGKLEDTEESESEVSEVPGAFYNEVIDAKTSAPPFPNNSWEVGQGVKDYIQKIKNDLMGVQQSAGGDVKFTIATRTAEGQDLPFKISTSASRYKNTQQAKNMSFGELSRERAKSVYNYMVAELSGLIPDIKKAKVIFDTDGENGDGSSGPNPPEPNTFSTGGGEPDSYVDSGDRDKFGTPHTDSHDYEVYKYCRINFAWRVDVEELPDGDTIPDQPKSFGDWDIEIVSKSSGGGGFRMTWGGWGNGGPRKRVETGNPIRCAAYD